MCTFSSCVRCYLCNCPSGPGAPHAGGMERYWSRDVCDSNSSCIHHVFCCLWICSVGTCLRDRYRRAVSQLGPVLTSCAYHWLWSRKSCFSKGAFGVAFSRLAWQNSKHIQPKIALVSNTAAFQLFLPMPFFSLPLDSMLSQFQT